MSATKVKALKLGMDLKSLHHELRTPLTAIAGIAHLLKTEELTEVEKNDYLNDLSEASERLINFIEQVLNSPMKDINLDKFDFLTFKNQTPSNDTMLLIDNDLLETNKPKFTIG